MITDIDKLVLRRVEGAYVWTYRVVGEDGVGRDLTVSNYYATDVLAYRSLREFRME